MNGQQIIMENIMEKASTYPGGATKLNIFQEILNHVVIGKFASLASQVNGRPPTSQELADTVIATAKEIKSLNPDIVTQDLYDGFINGFIQEPKLADLLRPEYELAAKKSKDYR